MEETPRANGRGWIVRDDDLLARCEVRGKVLLAAAPWLIRCRRVVPSEVEQALRP